MTDANKANRVEKSASVHVFGAVTFDEELRPVFLNRATRINSVINMRCHLRVELYLPGHVIAEK